MNPPAIHIRNLTVQEGHHPILDLAEIDVSEREMISIFGPNGAGKSTFLRCCLGLQHYANGSVFILGQELSRLNQLQLTRLRSQIGYVPQQLPARSEMPLTVREVASIGRTGLAGLFHWLGKEDWRMVDQWLDRLGVLDLADRKFCEISGGEQRKVMIARAMAQSPKLLLLDEPTANLDLGWRERLVKTIKTLYCESSIAIVLVCHELEALPECCRRVLLIDKGTLRATGTPESVFTDAQVASLFGPGLNIHHEGGRFAVIPEGGR